MNMIHPLQEYHKHHMALSYKNPHVKGLVPKESMPEIKNTFREKIHTKSHMKRTQKVNLRKYL